MIPLLIGIVSACSCIYLGDTQSKLSNGGIIFSGKIVDLEILESYPVQYRAQFEVNKYWKDYNNDFKKSVIISSVKNDGANCGYTFEEDKEYLIYAYVDQESGELTTNSCMGSSTLEEAQNEIQELNNLQQPTIPNEPKAEPQEDNSFSKFFKWLKSLFS